MALKMGCSCTVIVQGDIGRIIHNEKCPVHNLIQIKKSLPTEVKRAIAKTLSRNGYSVRDIMRFFDFKSPNSAANLLK